MTCNVSFTFAMHRPITSTLSPVPLCVTPSLSIYSPLNSPKCRHLKVTVGGPARTSRTSQAKPSGKVLLQILLESAKVLSFAEYSGVSPTSKLYGPSSAMSCASTRGPPFKEILKLVTSIVFHCLMSETWWDSTSQFLTILLTTLSKVPSLCCLERFLK